MWNSVFGFGGGKRGGEVAKTFSINGSYQPQFHSPRFGLGFQVGRHHEIIFSLTLPGLGSGIFISPRDATKNKASKLFGNPRDQRLHTGTALKIYLLGEKKRQCPRQTTSSIG